MAKTTAERHYASLRYTLYRNNHVLLVAALSTCFIAVAYLSSPIYHCHCVEYQVPLIQYPGL